MRALSQLIVLAGLLCVCVCYDMIIGDTVHRKMVFHQRVKDFAIPFKKRIKTLTYTDPDKRIIKVPNTQFIKRDMRINVFLISTFGLLHNL